MQCERCEATVEDERALRAHRRTECEYTCERCDAVVTGLNALDTHNLRFCSEQVLEERPPQGRAREVEVVERAAEQQPAAILSDPEPQPGQWRVSNPGPPPLPESVRDPQGTLRSAGNRNFNPTHAWYAHVPEDVDITGVSVTGLPNEIIHSAPSWQTHQVQRQVEQDKTLLTPVDRYGMKLRGSPYVHILPPRPDVWQGIVARWERLLPQEIAIEEDLLDQAEGDLARAVTRDERALARQRIRVFSTRVPQLRAINFDRIFGFLVREHEFSRQIGRTDVQIQVDQIDERVEAAMDRVFSEHAG